MANCNICGEEATVYVDGHPLCPACDHKRGSVNALWEQVKLAKADHLALSNQFDQLNREVDPDRTACGTLIRYSRSSGLDRR